MKGHQLRKKFLASVLAAGALSAFDSFTNVKAQVVLDESNTATLTANDTVTLVGTGAAAGVDISAGLTFAGDGSVGATLTRTANVVGGAADTAFEVNGPIVITNTGGATAQDAIITTTVAGAEVGDNTDIVLDGAISGAAGAGGVAGGAVLLVNGSGNLVINGANTFTGLTNVAGPATVIVNSSLTNAIVGNGATITNNGTLTDVATAAGSTINLNAGTARNITTIGGGGVGANVNLTGSSRIEGVNGFNNLNFGVANQSLTFGLEAPSDTIVTLAGGITGAQAGTTTIVADINSLTAKEGTWTLLTGVGDLPTLATGQVLYNGVTKTFNTNNTISGLSFYNIAFTTANLDANNAGDDTIRLTISRNTSIDSITGETFDEKDDAAYQQVADAIWDGIDRGNLDFSYFTTQDQATKLIAGLTPPNVDAASNSLSELNNTLATTVLANQSPAFCKGTKTWDAWTKGFGGNLNVDGESSYVYGDYNSRFGGAMLGANYRVSESFCLGGFASNSYLNVDQDSSSLMGSGSWDATGWGGGLAATYQADKYYFQGMFGASGFSGDQKRRVYASGGLFNEDLSSKTLTGDKNVTSYVTALKFGAPITSGDFIIEPQIQAAWIHNDESAFSESGSDIRRIKYSGRATDFFQAEVGAKVVYPMALSENTSLIPNLRVAWTNNSRLSNTNQDIEYTFSNKKVSLKSDNNNTMGALIEGGLDYVIANTDSASYKFYATGGIELQDQGSANWRAAGGITVSF